MPTLTFKFKSSGKTVQEVESTKTLETPTDPPIGIKTPLRLASTPSDGIYAMNHTLLEQIGDNLKNLILTNHGERLGLYDFGANLHPLMSELVANPDLEAEAMTRIRTAVSKYMPHVALEGFSTRVDHSNNADVAKLILRVIYGVPTLNVSNRAIEVVFHLM